VRRARHIACTGYKLQAPPVLLLFSTRRARPRRCGRNRSVRSFAALRIARANVRRLPKPLYHPCYSSATTSAPCRWYSDFVSAENIPEGNPSRGETERETETKRERERERERGGGRCAARILAPRTATSSPSLPGAFPRDVRHPSLPSLPATAGKQHAQEGTTANRVPRESHASRASYARLRSFRLVSSAESRASSRCTDRVHLSSSCPSVSKEKCRSLIGRVTLLIRARLAFRARALLRCARARVRAHTRTLHGCNGHTRRAGVVVVAGYEGVAGMESNGVHNLRGSVVRARPRRGSARAQPDTQ